MIPEIDIWRAANLMLKRYGEKALEESTKRVDELAAGEDYDGAATGAGSPQLSSNSPTTHRPDRFTNRNGSKRPAAPPFDRRVYS